MEISFARATEIVQIAIYEAQGLRRETCGKWRQHIDWMLRSGALLEVIGGGFIAIKHHMLPDGIETELPL